MNIFQTPHHSLSISLSADLNASSSSTVTKNYDLSNTNLFLPYELTLDFKGTNLTYPSHVFIDWDPEHLELCSEGSIELVTQYQEPIKKQISLSRYNIDIQGGETTLPTKITVVRVTYDSQQQEIRKQININIRSKIYQLGQFHSDSSLGSFTLLRTQFFEHSQILIHWYETSGSHLIIPVLFDTTRMV